MSISRNRPLNEYVIGHKTVREEGIEATACVCENSVCLNGVESIEGKRIENRERGK